jgi:membrane-associated phospholipid phosphatase
MNRMTSNTPKHPTIALWVWFIPLLPLSIFGMEYVSLTDPYWFLTINHLASHLPDLLWTSLSLLGNGWSVFALVFPMMLLTRKPFYAAIISGIFAGVFSHVAKSIANTSRPAGVIDPSTFHIIDAPLLYSAMPSGHTMTAFSVATAIFFSLPQQRRHRWLFIFLFAIGAGISRIAVGAHWPQDVLVGCALGIIAGLIGAVLVEKIPERLFLLTAWPFKIVCLFSTISLYLLVADTLDFQMNKLIQFFLAAMIFFTWAKLVSDAFKSSKE